MGINSQDFILTKDWSYLMENISTNYKGCDCYNNLFNQEYK